MAKQKPTCHSKQVVAKSRLFTIEALSLEFENGQKRVYERLKGRPHGAVLIVPISDDGYTYLVKEYAAGTERYELGFPKGLVDPGEHFLQAANRELQEEIGFAANNVEHLYSISLAPGYFSAQMEIVVATGLYPSQLEGDEPEPLEVVSWKLEDMESLLMRPDFSEARSIAAVFLVRQWLAQQTG